MTASKILFLVLDGIADRPCSELGDLTPLMAADAPNLNHYAKTGICGIMDPIAPGIRPGSDTAHLSLLGYPPEKYYTGRGPLEAIGSGILMKEGMIGFRANYATTENGMVTDRRAGRITCTEALSRSIEENVDLSDYDAEITFRSGAGHRAALALKGMDLSDMVSANDPKNENQPSPPIKPLDGSYAAKRTADICNSFVTQADEILKSHPINIERMKKGLPPANTVLIRGAGMMGHYEPFEEKFGIYGSVISAAALIRGIGTAVGLEAVHVEGITGSADSDLDAKLEAAVTEIGRKDFVLVNIKGADESGHDGDAVKKKEFIEKIDIAMGKISIPDECLLLICADHSTPCTIKDHSADPVPIIIHGDGVRVDDVHSYDEISCASGALCRITGGTLMPTLLDLINKTHKYGA